LCSPRTDPSETDRRDSGDVAGNASHPRRRNRYDLIALDEVGYVPLAEVGAEFLFQVIAERAEKAAVILTTNELLFNLLPHRRAPHGGKMNITHRSGVDHFYSAILISF
jgi:hypothetical protein